MEEATLPPKLGMLQPPSILLAEYETADSPGFIPGIEYLNVQYKYMRRVRGDGNCFYRAFVFAYVENLLKDYNFGGERKASAEAEIIRITEVIAGSKEELVNKHGYSEMAIESFHEMFLELLNDLFTYSLESLLNQFQEDGSSDYYTWYIRLLTAGKMRSEEDRFTPFIANDSFTNMESYCKKEVEPMGKECEQVHIIAIAEYMGVAVQIDYLDGRIFNKSEGLSHILCPGISVANGHIDQSEPSGGRSPVCLLYRPGHYDILYKN